MSHNVIIPVRLTRFRRKRIWKSIKFIRRSIEKDNSPQNVVAIKPIKKNAGSRKSKQRTAKDFAKAVANAIQFIRFNAGARGMKMPRININPRVTPHFRISAGALNAAPTAAKVLNVVNKVALPVALAMNTYQISTSVREDVKNGSSRNTINTVASVAGSWTGGFGGAASGAAIGSAIFPGIGTFVGGLVGGIAGAIGGSIGAAVVSDEVMENMNHDVQERICTHCVVKFKVRIYEGEKDVFLCENCR